MATYSITKARKQFEQLLKEVPSGEEVVITRRSKPIARIVAIGRTAQPENKQG